MTYFALYTEAMKIVWLLALVAVVGGAAMVAVKQGLIALPLPQADLQAEGAAQAAEYISGLDKSLATQIRQLRESGWQPPEILGSISSGVEGAAQATLSATVSSSPQEIWDSFRKQGAQAALGQVVESAEVSVNSVSQNVVNEARYQYCLGVVEAREKQE